MNAVGALPRVQTPETERWAPPKGGRFAFEFPEFRRADSRFALDADRGACLKVELGDLRAAIPLRQIAATFDLPAGHPDRALLARIPAALKFVSAIAADDPIPNEIVDGSPSWVPKDEYLERAARKLDRALGAGPAAREGEAFMSASDDAIAALRLQFARFGRIPTAADLFDVIGGIARGEWLCRRVVAVQSVVGGLARAATAHPVKSAAGAARSGALALRAAAIWAGDRAMRIDALVADPVDALADPDGFRARAHPILAALRAFAVDVDPLLATWRKLRERPDGALSGEIEALAGMAIARYAKFAPRQFETAANAGGSKRIGRTHSNAWSA